MGHQALVAYQLENSTYSLHYSQRGAHDLKLRDSIAEETPFGGTKSADWTHEVISDLRSGEPFEDTIQEISSETQVAVGPSPIGTASTFPEIRNEHVNYLHHEAFYVVTLDWSIRTYLPLWFGLMYDSESIESADLIGNGALVEITDVQAIVNEWRALRSKWIALRDVLGDFIDNELYAPKDGPLYMRAKLEQWVTSSTNVLYTSQLSIGEPS